MTIKQILKCLRNNLMLLLFLELLIVAGALTIAEITFAKYFSPFSIGSGYDFQIQRIIISAVSIVTLFILYYLLEKRYTRNIIFKQPKLIIIGTAIGFVLFAVTNLIIFLLGGYKITGINQGNGWILILFSSLSAGFSEEVIFRGIIYRHVENRFGTSVALIISALFFGFAHISNPNSSVFAAIAIALEAGIMLGIAYTFSKSIWLPIGIHFAWNFTQGGIFSARISGLDFAEGIFTGAYSGHHLLTGGDFGPEASLPALLVCTSFGIWLIYLTIKQGKYIRLKLKNKISII